MAVAQKARHLFLTNKVRLTDQFGLAEQVCAPQAELPEFLIVGSTNVGKSSLLTALLDPPSRNSSARTKAARAKDVPRVSKWAGFTATMSVYTVGKLLRLVDSPGYGFKSSAGQGSVATAYLDVRAPLLRQAYVLIHAKRRVGVQDREVCAILANYGVPFQFVMTKCDLGGSVPDVAQAYADVCRELRVPGAETVLQTSAKQGFGVDELRADVLQLSGLLEAR